MGILTTLQEKTLESRKTSDPQAAFLVLTLAQAGDLAKADGNKPVSDVHAGRAIATALKQAKTLLEGDPATGTPAIPADSTYAAQIRVQRDLLDSLVVKAPTGDDLRREIRAVADANDVTIEMKSMKRIMELLNTMYDGQVDGKAVAAAIQAGV